MKLPGISEEKMSEKAPTTVTLFVVRYNELVEAELKLRALEAAGVEDWEWYGEAMKNKIQIKDGPRQVFL